MSERRRGALDTMVGRNLTRIGFSEGVNDVGWYMVLYESELREDLRQGGEGTKSKKEEEMLCINLYFVSRERRRNGGRDGGGSDRTTGGWIGFGQESHAGQAEREKEIVCWNLANWFSAQISAPVWTKRDVL